MNISMNIDLYHVMVIVAFIFSTISIILCLIYRTAIKEISKIVYGLTTLLKKFMASKLTNSEFSIKDINNVLKGNIQSGVEQSSDSKSKS